MYLWEPLYTHIHTASMYWRHSPGTLPHPPCGNSPPISIYNHHGSQAHTPPTHPQAPISSSCLQKLECCNNALNLRNSQAQRWFPDNEKGLVQPAAAPSHQGRLCPALWRVICMSNNGTGLWDQPLTLECCSRSICSSSSWRLPSISVCLFLFSLKIKRERERL